MREPAQARAESHRRTSTTVALALPVLLALLAATACKHNGRGPMERSGRAVDRAGEKVGDAFRK